MKHIDDIALELGRVLPGLKMARGEELSRYSSFKIGGPADLFIEPSTEDELIQSLKILRDNEIRTFIIGRASNLLFSEKGYRGAIIKLAENYSSTRVEGRRLIARSGTSLAELANFALAHSLAGLEFASGIPGSVGGAVTMNAGAYGGEMKDVVEGVRVLDENLRVLNLSNEDLDFGYRHSLIQKHEYILIEASFLLKEGPKEEIKARMDDYNARRREKQPLNLPSCGSTFKRPKVGYAAAMIEESNLKGLKFGGARVSDKHAGFIVNEDGASFADILNLIEIVKKTVYDAKGVLLETEMKIIGEEGPLDL